MASSLNMIAPLALLFLCAIATPGSSQGIGGNTGGLPVVGGIGSLNTIGSLLCTPGLILCPLSNISAFPPLANATVSLSLGTRVLAQNVTDASGRFHLISNVFGQTLVSILSDLSNITVKVMLPVNGCPALPTISNLTSSVAAIRVVGNALNLSPIGPFV